MNPQDQVVIKELPGNDVCADCGSSYPEWASVSFGTLICINCNGIHRSLGTHISFVRSVTMDTWTDKQLAIMKSGGNQACREYIVTKHGVATGDIRDKYSSPAAQLYKQVLLARYEGKPEPTELPPPMESASNNKKKASYAGFGSSPPPRPQKRKVLTKQNVTRSVVVMGVAMATAALFFLPSSQAALLSPTQVQSFYNAVGPALDLMSLVEDKPRNYAIEKADLNKNCKSIMEIGSGTGRTAESILKEHAGTLDSYTCIELSSRMADLTRRRLDHYDTRQLKVNVLQENALTTAWPSNMDCVLAFYVLDILSQEDIQVFLDKVRESLNESSGRLALVSITTPTSGMWSRAVMGTWQTIVNRFPLLLGGCRPIELSKLLPEAEWNVVEYEEMSVLGYTSEIVIATPR